MNNIFRGFYTPKEEDYKDIWNNQKTLFIFDTNTLLNLYRCEEQTKEDIIRVMQTLASRSWFPFQVCLEYQRNRTDVIAKSVKSLEVLKTNILSLVDSTDSALSKAQVKKHLYSSLSDEVAMLKETLSTAIDAFIKNKIDTRIDAKNEITKSDSVRKSLDKIIGDNCGSFPTQALINDINSEGESRFSNSIPPGFMDANKKGEKINIFNGVEFKAKFGDLYLWKEIIEKSKTLNDHNIVFITDDSKKDWWFTHENKTIGPSEHLQTEIYSNTNIKSFRMLTHSTFLFEADKYLKGLKIQESSLEDIKGLSLPFEKYPEEVQAFKASKALDNFITLQQKINNQHLIKKYHSKLNKLFLYENPKSEILEISIKEVNNLFDRYEYIKKEFNRLTNHVEIQYDSGLINSALHERYTEYLRLSETELLDASKELQKLQSYISENNITALKNSATPIISELSLKLNMADTLLGDLAVFLDD